MFVCVAASVAVIQAKNTVITCNDATKFGRDGDKTPSKFEDLKVGQQVRAYYIKADNVAKAVIIAKPTASNVPCALPNGYFRRWQGKE